MPYRLAVNDHQWPAKPRTFAIRLGGGYDWARKGPASGPATVGRATAATHPTGRRQRSGRATAAGQVPAAGDRARRRPLAMTRIAPSITGRVPGLPVCGTGAPAAKASMANSSPASCPCPASTGPGSRRESALRSAHVAIVRCGECGLYRCSCQPRRPGGSVGEP